MSTLQATPSPLSSAPSPVRWTIFARATSTPESSSQPRAPAKIEPRERVQYEAPEDLSGRVLCERYELTQRLGYGGMGEVYEARFLASGQRVAVKLLFARFADEPEMMTRFRHELQVLEAIEHPGIVRVRDFDQTGDRRPFLVMELIEGRDLRALLREQRKLPLAEVIELGLQICEALAILHERGVIHRDLTPRNVLIDERSPKLRAKLIDFGISKLTSLFYAEERAYMTPPEQRLRTRTGRILGTPGYTAPEVADEPPSPQQDIFSLGVVLFELATGKRPPASWLRSIPDDVDHEGYGLDRHTWMTLLKAIEPDPKVRYQAALEMGEALADLRLIVGDDDDDDDDVSGARAGVAKRREAVDHSQASVASGMSRPAAEPKGGASSSSISTGPPESRATRHLLPAESTTGRDRGRSMWLAIVILGLYATVDLALHLRGYLVDPPSAPDPAAEISAPPSRALTIVDERSSDHGRDGVGGDVDDHEAIASDAATEHPPTNAGSGSTRAAHSKTDPVTQALKEIEQAAPTSSTAAEAPPVQAEPRKAANTPAPRLSRASVLKVVKPKSQELALCLRSVGADPVDAKIDVSETGRVTSIKLTPEVPYIVERCVVRILEPMAFSSASRSSSHRLSLRDL